MTYATYHDQGRARDVARESVPTFNPLIPFTVDTAQEIKPNKDFSRKNLFTPLWNIISHTKYYRTVKPIRVQIYQEDNIFFAENDNLVLIGTGSNIDEAITDLSKHIIYFYRYYNKLPLNRAIGDAVRLKRIYKTLFEED